MQKNEKVFDVIFTVQLSREEQHKAFAFSAKIKARFRHKKRYLH